MIVIIFSQSLTSRANFMRVNPITLLVIVMGVSAVLKTKYNDIYRHTL